MDEVRASRDCDRNQLRRCSKRFVLGKIEMRSKQTAENNREIERRRTQLLVRIDHQSTQE